MSNFIQKVLLIFIWKLFPFALGLILGIAGTLSYLNGYISINLPDNILF